MGTRAASISLLCALTLAPAAYAADASTGGAVAPPTPPVPAAPADPVAPVAPVPPTPVAPPTDDPAPLAPSPEAAVNEAVSSAPPKPADDAQPIEIAAVVRDSPPLRSPSAIASQGGDADDPDVVEVPVPRVQATPVKPEATVQLPRTGFDIGLMTAVGLVMISGGLMLVAITTPARPSPGRISRLGV